MVSWDLMDSVNWCLINHDHKVINITDAPNDNLKIHQESAIRLKRKGNTEYKIERAGYGIDFMIAMKPKVVRQESGKMGMHFCFWGANVRGKCGSKVNFEIERKN